MRATLDPVGRFAMRYRWILAAILSWILAFILIALISCIGLDDSYPMPNGAPRLYNCTEQQHDKALKEAKEALAIVKDTDANTTSWYYGAAIMRNCVRKVKP